MADLIQEVGRRACFVCSGLEGDDDSHTVCRAGCATSSASTSRPAIDFHVTGLDVDRRLVSAAWHKERDSGNVRPGSTDRIGESSPKSEGRWISSSSNRRTRSEM